MLPMSTSYLWVRTRSETHTATTQAFCDQFPPKISRIIGDYLYDEINPSLIGERLKLDLTGKVLNPWVRENIKRILGSANCLPWCKEVTICSINNEPHRMPYLVELAQISNEIVAEGGRVNLDNVMLNQIDLCLNMRNASMRNFVLSDSLVTGDMTGADLTGSHFTKVKFEYLLLIRALCTDMIITNSSFECVFMTGTDITDPALLQYRCVLTDPGLLHYRPVPFIMSVLMSEPQPHVLLHNKKAPDQTSDRAKVRPSDWCVIS